jgi:hypothetical protein
MSLLLNYIFQGSLKDIREVAKFIDSEWGDKVVYGLSYRPASLPGRPVRHSYAVINFIPPSQGR